ncbi:MAG: PepSY domain-containing protein, partial [Deltaproteobacteria bacterium]
IEALLLWAVMAQAGPAALRTDFPGVETSVSTSGERLTHASGFRAPGLGETPEAAARAFLARYAAAFGIGPKQVLVLQAAPASGQPGAVRLERRIDGLPIFDGDIVVGVDTQGAVFLVNTGDIPGDGAGRFRISRKVAIDRARAAIQGLETTDTPRAERGWRSDGKVVRPVWRVDFAAARPPGDWRTFVDAETGKVLQRMNLRMFGTTGR